MTSEVCPFCGKPFKRLKSHLPHCKAADRPRTPSTQRDAAVSQRASSPSPPSSQLTSALSETTSKSKKSTPTSSSTITPQVKKSKKVPELSSGSPPLSESPTAVAPLSLPSSSSSTSLSTSTRKKKQKLSDQIKTAVVSPSSTISFSSPAAPSPSPSLSKPKKKGLQARIEAAMSSPVPKGSPEGTKSDKSVSTTSSVATNLLSSKAPTLTGTQANPDQDPYPTLPAPPSTGTKPKGASKTKASNREREGAGNGARPSGRVWEDWEGERERAWGSGSSHKARITLQDVKVAVGRSNTGRQSSKPSILSRIETTDDLPCKPQTRAPLNSSQDTEPSPFRSPGTATESQQASPRDDGSSQPKPTSLLSPVPSPAALPTSTVGMNEGLKLHHHKMELGLTVARRLSARGETVNERWTTETPQLEIRKQNVAACGVRGSLTQRSLGQVTLREFPQWLTLKTPIHPREVVETLQRGWQWYYRRYMDVRKGGVGGVAMLVAGYCVLGYIWRYPHLKRDRWRKYH